MTLFERRRESVTTVNSEGAIVQEILDEMCHSPVNSDLVQLN